VQLSDKDEAVGAQGVPLTPGRSIAVDKSLHVYGTPFFIEGELPIDTEHSKTPFRRLMIAQDTGSAIVGPARADLYFGAGADAGKVSGRLRHSMRFVMLVPNSLDPVMRARKLPVPDERPSEKIAKLFPKTDPQKDVKNGARPAEISATATGKDSTSGPAAAKSGTSGSAVSKPVAQAAAAPVPLPAARPHIAPVQEGRRHRQLRRYRIRQ
jgi:membrane-bound lytic murein transglycosylase A